MSREGRRRFWRGEGSEYRVVREGRRVLRFEYLPSWGAAVLRPYKSVARDCRSRVIALIERGRLGRGRGVLLRGGLLDWCGGDGCRRGVAVGSRGWRWR